jgi:hypothetical protein
MIEIDRSIVSRDVVTCNFTCNLNACKGACCVMGDSGAPLEPDEAELLREIYPLVKPYLSAESVKSIEEQGTSVIDVEQDVVTPLNNGKECAYVVFREGIAYCAIEQAYNDGVISFRKPLSCHLYPIRIKKYPHFDAINYDRWEVCKDAVIKGNELKVPVYVFAGEALRRKYGKDWYEQLHRVAQQLNRENLNKP